MKASSSPSIEGLLVILPLCGSLSCQAAMAQTTNQVSLAGSNDATLLLAGEWSYRLDPADKGLAEGWPNQLSAEGRVELPGTTDTRGLGPANAEASEHHLARTHKYRGTVWFERNIEIPPSWAGRAVTLDLERVQWESRVWVDGRPAGMQDSLSTPHRYDLTGLLAPGRHRFTLRVDNRIKYTIGEWAHAITDETQGNWNGAIGRMELRVEPLVAIHHARIAVALGATNAHVTVRVNNRAAKPATIKLAAEVKPGGRSATSLTVTAAPGLSAHEVDVALLSNAARWDEFSPVMQTMRISLSAPDTEADRREVRFGLLEFKAGQRQFELNGRPIFLRGNLECAIWPLTGHPPMTPEGGWRKLMATVKEHGMNHLRFHSWCPPEAAFAAADEAGVIFQVELPLWNGNVGNTESRLWLASEARRIVETYGNHPSFRLLSMGNELGGDAPWFMNLVRELKGEDARILYTSSTHPTSPTSSDDYFVSANTAAGAVRGATAAKSRRAGFDGTFTAGLAAINRPLIAHEVGQFSMFFNPAEIAKYTGPMKARNLELCRAAMEKNGLLDMAEPFRQSSARFQLSLYKREIEQLIATPELAGFQALGLQDFSGQGTTMCGALDAFWESKGVIAPASWRRFCGATVLLARFPEAVLTDADTFEASVQVSHFGPQYLKAAVVRWELRAGNRVAASDAFPAVDLPTGKLTTIGKIRQPLAGLVSAPASLSLSLRLEGQPVTNDWNLWVYPSRSELPDAPTNALVGWQWNNVCTQALAEGRDVILIPALRGSQKTGVPTHWEPVSWNILLFGNQPSTIGIHLDPKHPLFARFPSAGHSDTQWQKLCEGAVGVDLTGTSLRPVMWLIDDFHAKYQRKLGAVVEARVGRGRLLICTLNLAPANRQFPEVRQFFASLYAYAGSPRFQPEQSVTPEELDRLLGGRGTEVAAAWSDIVPTDLARAILDVAAAGKARSGNSKPDRQLDEIGRQREGFAYDVEYETAWKDERCTAWVGRAITVRVTVPPDFQGRLSVRFDDSSDEQRDGHMFFNGQDQSLIGPHAPGRWIVFKLDGKKTKTGEYTLKADRTSGPNLMISRLAILDGEAK